MSVKPIFVLGSPRSGTTMMGNYIGSCPSVYNVGEYRAFYVALELVPRELRGSLSPREWLPHQDAYLREVWEHAVDFIARVTRDEGCTAYCDATPRNLLIGRRLAELFPEALFVLNLRHYTGVVQSLEMNSFPWLQPTWEARADLWSASYVEAAFLPRERTIAFGYDRFCAEPEAVLAELKADLADHGVDPSELDDSVLARSHATARRLHRPTIAEPGAGLRPIPSYNPDRWTPDIAQRVQPIVSDTNDVLRLLFPSYQPPAGFVTGP